ncbi:hypothetical protein [Nocardia sp. NRRL S-836]|uniref:hypothetical protein n=1 Tax=Nocardia sp. NRRL S-836 TaxID=1519492 RepID=UPI0012F742EF|nr:hypothetical protein [Nocardia sp. NRRL S-836]
MHVAPSPRRRGTGALVPIARIHYLTTPLLGPGACPYRVNQGVSRASLSWVDGTLVMRLGSGLSITWTKEVDSSE